MSRDLLKLTYEQPLLMRLYREPVMVEGRWGHQWQYVCNDDEAICFLDGEAHTAIQASGAQPGQQILLTKAKSGGKAIYHAQTVDDEVTMPDWVRRPEPPATDAAPIRNARTKRPAGNGNGNGHHPPPPSSPPSAGQPPAPHGPGANVYALALRAAIDAAHFAQQYADSKGLKLQFSTEDIRCIAATLYIDQRKETR